MFLEASSLLKIFALKYQYLRLAQNTYLLEIDEQPLDLVQLDSLTSQASDGHGHMTDVVRFSRDMMSFGKSTDPSRDTVCRACGHLSALFSAQPALVSRLVMDEMPLIGIVSGASMGY